MASHKDVKKEGLSFANLLKFKLNQWIIALTIGMKLAIKFNAVSVFLFLQAIVTRIRVYSLSISTTILHRPFFYSAIQQKYFPIRSGQNYWR